MAKRNNDPWIQWAKKVDPASKGDLFNDLFNGPNPYDFVDIWAQHKWLILNTKGEQREAVKREVLQIASRLDAGITIEEAFALKKPNWGDEERWIDTRPVQKHEPMPKEFSPEDQFRARGLGIRLDLP